MPNGSLDQHLFRRGGAQEQRAAPLSWASRYGIVADVASGLHYVHHEYGRTVLHRDIKASNVMLDASFSARLGDFGLARVIDFDRSSFTDASCPLLVDFVWRMHGRGALVGAVDQDLGTAGYDADEATRLLLLGLACSSPNPGDRPTMPEVLQIVSKKAPPPEVPLFKPSFVWPPEGGAAQFSLSDIESSGGSFTGTGNGSSTRATQESSYDSFRQPPSAPNNSQEYFPALSSGR
ncbi:unnamed protein product [Triticum turgidum subsp. durum]|uniref:Protein kinase domain-containing protein n=1 Tax=Triticum turgidum subsp. durum TaxID=4567 RepID=A0A9R0ZZN2_TRITD|nr:unnamed protein product [Triticum turgidum subsp. durum]